MSYTVDFAPVCIWLERPSKAKKSDLACRNQQLMILMGRQNECEVPARQLVSLAYLLILLEFGLAKCSNEVMMIRVRS